MQLTALTTIGAAFVGTAAIVGTVALLGATPAPQEAQIWVDAPAPKSSLTPGEVAVTLHTNVDGVTAIRATISRDGKDVDVLTDTDLTTTARGKDADVLYWFYQEWGAQPGGYELAVAAYKGNAVLATTTTTFTVLGSLPSGDSAPSASPTASPSAEPSATASPTASPSPSPSATPSTTASAGPEPSAKPTTKPTAKPTTKPTTKPSPTPKPPKTTPTPEPTAPPAAGKVTRSTSDPDQWTNTFTATGFRPKNAQVFIEVNLHNTVTAPYYYGWQSYPCGTATAYEGSGATATFQCSATFTIQPPGNWRTSEFWRSMPASTFRVKIVVDGKSYYGNGGNWTPAGRAV